MQEKQSIPSNNGKKTADGRFAKGNKHGKGRPQGSRNKVTIALEAGLFEQAAPITQKIIDKALEGDVTCLKMCLDRIYPVPKERPVEAAISPIKTVDNVVKAMQDVMAQVATGKLYLSEAAALFDRLKDLKSTLMEVVELADLKEKNRELLERATCLDN